MVTATQSLHPNLLVLADNLHIHPDLLIGNGNGIFGAGAQGSGKSVALKLLLEQIAQKANTPLVAFDREKDLIATVEFFPRGVVATYHNCPTARDIFSNGLQAVFDLSTWPNMDVAGAMIARLVNQLAHEAEQTPSYLRVPCPVALDEAAFWLPQDRGKSLDEETYKALRDAFEAMASWGRKRGLVPMLFAQKFSRVNKDVLSPGTYILMQQVLHTEQQRYLDYILPVNEFKFLSDRQIKMHVGDLGTGDAIVRLATGEQRIVHFYECESPHNAHTPKTLTALNRYASVAFNPTQRYGAYIEDEEMEVSPDENVTEIPANRVTETTPKRDTKVAKRDTNKHNDSVTKMAKTVTKLDDASVTKRTERPLPAPGTSVVEPRARAALSENPLITDVQLAKACKCSISDARKWRERIAAE